MKFGNKKHTDVPNLIYGRNACLSSLNSGKVFEVFLEEGFADQRILSVINKSDLKVHFISSKALSAMTNNGAHQGIALSVPRFEYASLEDIIRASKKEIRPIVLILDEINDPHNFGAIIRSADAFGVSGIIIKNRRQVMVNMTVAKVSTGAIDHVKIAQVNNLSKAIQNLKDNGFWVYAAEGKGATNYQEIQYDRPVALVVGSEGEGISKLILDNADFIIKIPMFGSVNSLNVSVATGILLSRIKNG